MYTFRLIIGVLSVFIISANDLNYKSFNIFRWNNSLIREKLNDRSRMPFIFCGSAVPLLKWKFCDGKRDCADGSDETANLCKDLKCTENEFRCTYGACIPKRHMCDGDFHCADGSDEDPTVCYKSCIVPRSYKNTVYYVWGCNRCTEGSEVKEGTILKLHCLNNAFPNSIPIQFTCENSKWLPFVPSCDDEPGSRPFTYPFWDADKHKWVNSVDDHHVDNKSNHNSLNSSVSYAHSAPVSLAFLITNTGVLSGNNQESHRLEEKNPLKIFYMDENSTTVGLRIENTQDNGINKLKTNSTTITISSDQKKNEYELKPVKNITHFQNTLDSRSNTSQYENSSNKTYLFYIPNKNVTNLLSN